MTPEAREEMHQIANFCSYRLDKIMPSLKEDTEGTPAWPFLQMVGGYLNFRMECLVQGEENNDLIHEYALAKTLALPQTQQVFSQILAQQFNHAAGVEE